MPANSAYNVAPNHETQLTNSNTKSIINLKGENKMEASEVLEMCGLDNQPNQSNQSSTATTTTTTTGFHHGVPVGTYLTKIVGATTKTHPEGEHDVVKVELEIQSQSQNGHILRKYYNLTSKESVQFFRREMKEIGFPVSSRSDLETLAELLPQAIVNAQVADHPSGNQVIYLKGVNNTKKVTKVDPNALWV